MTKKIETKRRNFVPFKENLPVIVHSETDDQWGWFAGWSAYKIARAQGLGTCKLPQGGWPGDSEQGE